MQNTHITTAELNELDLRIALGLIKEHITSEETKQNADLHRAVQLIVGVSRKQGMLVAGRN